MEMAMRSRDRMVRYLGAPLKCMWMARSARITWSDMPERRTGPRLNHSPRTLWWWRSWDSERLRAYVAPLGLEPALVLVDHVHELERRRAFGGPALQMPHGKADLTQLDAGQMRAQRQVDVFVEGGGKGLVEDAGQAAVPHGADLPEHLDVGEQAPSFEVANHLAVELVPRAALVDELGA